ncbi:hypothetical protein JW877_04940 [bacterium]|nr:hypothetical protein [bacterium]
MAGIALQAGGLDSLAQNFEGIIYIINIQNGQDIYCYNGLPGEPWLFPVGSTIKPFTALAALRKGVWDPEQPFCCQPAPIDSPLTKRCWYTPGHGVLNFPEALAHSCNLYFLELASKLDYKFFLEVLEEFKLTVPDNLRFQNQTQKLKAMVGLDYSLLLNLKSLLRAYAALINGGILFPENNQTPNILKLSHDNIFLIREGMRLSATIGTGIKAQEVVGETPILSKTGTAPYCMEGRYIPSKTHALFIGFAPENNPVWGVLVMAKEGMGALEGAIKGGQILKYCLQN